MTVRTEGWPIGGLRVVPAASNRDAADWGALPSSERRQAIANLLPMSL
jgi:hypothetical protein